VRVAVKPPSTAAGSRPGFLYRLASLLSFLRGPPAQGEGALWKVRPISLRRAHAKEMKRHVPQDEI